MGDGDYVDDFHDDYDDFDEAGECLRMRMMLVCGG